MGLIEGRLPSGFESIAPLSISTALGPKRKRSSTELKEGGAEAPPSFTTCNESELAETLFEFAQFVTKF